MAINNGRNFSSGDDALAALQNIMNTGYASGDDALDEVSRIVLGDSNNVGYTPNTTTPTGYFSLPETLRLQAQGYKDLGNDVLANAYNNLWTGSSQYDNIANQIGNFYNTLANDITGRESMLANEKYKLAQQLNQDLLNQKDYVMGMFGPDGTLTNEVNKYYTDMGNYLATEAGREAANIAAQGVHSGASLGAIRAQQNEAYNNAYSRYLQAKEQEINAKQQIASNLINYMSTLRKEYGDTTNQYIISQYERANDLLNSISTDLTKQYVSLAGARLSASGSGSGGAQATAVPQTRNVEESKGGNFIVTETDTGKGNAGNGGGSKGGSSSAPAGTPYRITPWQIYKTINPAGRVIGGLYDLYNAMK